MNDTYLKLTAYFAERQRAGSRFLAEAMLDLYADREVATSVMLRGIASFGPRHVIRSDQSLTLSEDPPVAIAAVDTAETIGALVDDVVDDDASRPDHPGARPTARRPTCPTAATRSS